MAESLTFDLTKAAIRRAILLALRTSDTTVAEALESTGNSLHVHQTNGLDFVDAANNVAVVEQGQFAYETVAASQTDQVLGATGAAGDFLHKLILVVATAATAATSIKDGAGSAIAVLPNSPGGGVGVYVIEFNIVSATGAWSVTTGAGVSAIGIGRFTA